MRYYIAVLDDNQSFLSDFKEMLRDALNAISHDADILLFASPEELSSYLEAPDTQIDIAIVDILLNDCNGVQWAKQMQLKHPGIKLIFITAVLENAVDIFDATPCYFLTKPVQEKKLMAAVKAAFTQIKMDEDHILPVSQKGMIIGIRLNRLMYVESVGRDLIFHESDRKTKILAKLQNFLPRLGDNFLAIHKSFAVNIRFVRSISRTEVELYSGEKLPISRSRLPDVRARFFALLEEKVKRGKEQW